jgi:hypothetical protein
VKFDRLHQNRFTSSEFVPVIGDMMPARWSFEALAVEQFKSNKYEKIFFRLDMDESQNYWYASFLIKSLKKDLWKCQHFKDSAQYKDVNKNNFKKLDYHIGQLTRMAGFDAVPEALKIALREERLDSAVARDGDKYLDSLSMHFRSLSKQARNLKDTLTKKIGERELMNLKDSYYNKQLESFVLNIGKIDQSPETQTKIIQKYEPGFMKPTSKYGRAQFYAPYKQVGNIQIDTFWFNLMVLWIVTLVLYVALYYNLLQKLVTGLENLRLKEPEK